MHTEGDPGQVIAAARAIVHEEAPEAPPRFRTFKQIYSASLGSRRFNLTLVGVFAFTALSLAVAGVYGVVAYGVAQRTREIGVRMALGARSPDVLGLILRQGMTTTLIGVAIGVVGSLATARTIESLLFDVKPTDPLTFLGGGGAVDRAWRAWPATYRRVARRRWIRWWRCDTTERERVRSTSPGRRLREGPARRA